MLGKDLKPGMMIDRGLVLRVDLEGDNAIWAGIPNYTYADINDPYYGPLTGQLLLDDDYPIMYEKGSVGYKRVILELAQALEQAAQDRLKDKDEVLACIR